MRQPSGIKELIGKFHHERNPSACLAQRMRASGSLRNSIPAEYEFTEENVKDTDAHTEQLALCIALLRDRATARSDAATASGKSTHSST